MFYCINRLLKFTFFQHKINVLLKLNRNLTGINNNNNKASSLYTNCRFTPWCVCLCAGFRTRQGSLYTNCSRPWSTRLRRDQWTPRWRKPNTHWTIRDCWGTTWSTPSWLVYTIHTNTVDFFFLMLFRVFKSLLCLNIANIQCSYDCCHNKKASKRRI